MTVVPNYIDSPSELDALRRHALDEWARIVEANGFDPATGTPLAVLHEAVVDLTVTVLDVDGHEIEVPAPRRCWYVEGDVDA